MRFASLDLPGVPNYVAPDHSEIRLLLDLNGGGLAHCTLPNGQVTQAVAHRTVEEIWYVVEGHGKIWRKQFDAEEAHELHPGTCVTLPVGTHFQFRCTGEMPLRILIATMPPWPGPNEAYIVENHWVPTS